MMALILYFGRSVNLWVSGGVLEPEQTTEELNDKRGVVGKFGWTRCREARDCIVT